MSAQLPTPDQIIQLGFGFWGSKALLSAIELGLFTELANGPLDAHTLGERLGLYPRSREEQRGTRDFLDALVALKMLECSNDGLYRNTDATNTFLDRRKPSYVGGILEMANARLYGFWRSLTEALRADQPQNEIKRGENLFNALYTDQGRLEAFLKAMTGISMGAAMAIAQKFPWSEYRTMIDIGTAQGALPVQVALAHQHLTGGGFDLPPVGPIFQKYVSEHGLARRLRFYEGNFFRDPLPTADVLVMGHILHDWDLDTKRMLLKKAHDALPDGGALIVYEALIDDDRRANAFGLLMSLNMLIETQGGFDYTGKDCSEWMREAGFRQTRVEHLVGPDGMVVGVK
jgi:O-methyltransferase domain/Dimerisation domain